MQHLSNSLSRSESPISDRIFLRAPPTFELPQTSIISWSPAKVQVFRAGFAKIFYRFPHDDVPGAILVKSFVRSRELVNCVFSVPQVNCSRHGLAISACQDNEAQANFDQVPVDIVEKANGLRRRAVPSAVTEVQLVELRQSFT